MASSAPYSLANAFCVSARDLASGVPAKPNGHPPNAQAQLLQPQSADTCPVAVIVLLLPCRTKSFVSMIQPELQV